LDCFKKEDKRGKERRNVEENSRKCGGEREKEE